MYSLEQSTLPFKSVLRSSLVSLSSCLIGTAGKLESLQLGCSITRIPETWEHATDRLLSEEHNNCIRLSRDYYTKLVVCGAKGVGKSTCLRYTVNKLLQKFSQIAVIDCDPGQPEFTGKVVIMILY